MLVDYIPLRLIIDEWIEDNPFEGTNVPISQVYRWAYDVIKYFMVVDTSKYKVTLINVRENGTADLPEDIHKISSVAYRIFDKNIGKCCNIEKVVEYTQKTCEKDCDLKIRVDCKGCGKPSCECGNSVLEVDVSKIWEMQNPWYDVSSKFAKPYDSNMFNYLSKHKYKFQQIAHTAKDYFGAKQEIGCSTECRNIPTYRVQSNRLIELDIYPKKGEVIELLISYLGKRLDENGNPIVPDHPDVKEAIQSHLSYKFFSKMGLAEKDPYYDNKALMHYNLSAAAIGRARAAISIPEFDEFRAGLHDIFSSSSPNMGPTNPSLQIRKNAHRF